MSDPMKFGGSVGLTGTLTAEKLRGKALDVWLQDYGDPYCEAAVQTFAAPDPVPGPVVPAPKEWRRKNWLRKLLPCVRWDRENWYKPWKLFQWLVSGEHFVPVRKRLALAALGAAGGVLTAELYAVHIKADGTRVNYGLVGRHLVVTAGKNYLAACFPNTNEPENMKYHGVGTGATAAAAGDTALQTESTTALNPDNTRATGSQSSSTNTYTTVGTPAFDATAAITEWGLLSQAATGGGTLFDRQVFSAINVGSGDSIQFTYVLTIS